MDIDKLKYLLKKHGKIEVKGIEEHSKASEHYVHVVFSYKNCGEIWEGLIPYHNRRLGIDIEDEKELVEHLKSTYPLMEKDVRTKWYKKEMELWENEYKSKDVTKPYFDNMARNGILGKWGCRKCVDKITGSSNNARRIQDIKEMGYATATSNRYCESCKKNTTQDLLLPIDKAEPTGYEIWSKKLRSRIMEVLEYYDVYEDRYVQKNKFLLPDHKFPEIRWDAATKEINAEDMSNDEIASKFQLMTNQRNEQKREVCRKCYQEGKRGKPFGINYFYSGNEEWPSDVPKRGKSAEKGCIGCGWYDMKKWRESLNNLLAGMDKSN